MTLLNFKPQKSLGQNFLIDKNIALKIIDALDLNENEVVLEIGFGKKFLTNFILQHPIHYIGVELDERLFNTSQLNKNFVSLSQKFYNANFLDLDLESFFQEYNSKLIIVGNIPYRITSSILLKLLSNYPFITKIVLMLQKEVAERITSPPGNRVYSTLSVLMQTFTNIQPLFDVSPNCFNPKPKVISRVIRIIFKNEIPIERNEVKHFFNFIKTVFNQKRKILRNSLHSVFKSDQIYKIKGFPLEKEQLSSRAEQISPTGFVELFNFCKSLKIRQ
ncbi:MAG: 16S rRNA (adenine(1518)-N(6)/adenine(1519)-N(6))-dimethyltransferase RsmA [Candidatus Kapaibacteriales bacterium]